MAEEKVVATEKVAKKDKKDAKKDKVPFGTKVANVLRSYKSELKKIVWFSREQTFKSSLIVIVSIVITSACIGGLDWCFSQLLMLLGKLV